jgi:hypothetical protein
MVPPVKRRWIIASGTAAQRDSGTGELAKDTDASREHGAD